MAGFWLVVLASMEMLLGVVAPAHAQIFPDVPVGAGFSQAITDLADRGVVSGFDDGTFLPTGDISRQQFAKIAVLALGIPVSEADVCPFRDVQIGGPGTLYPDNFVAAAVRFGLIRGKTATRFDPYSPISRAQLVSILTRAMGNQALFKRQSLEPPSSFASALGDFSPDHAGNWRLAEYNGLLSGLAGYGIHWDPWAQISRGEAAQLLWNLLELRGRPDETVAESPLGATPDRLFPSPILGLSSGALSWVKLRAEPSLDFGPGVYEAASESVQAVSLLGDSWSQPHLVAGPPPLWEGIVQRGDDVGWVVSLGGGRADLPATGVWTAKASGENARMLSPATDVFRGAPAFAGESAYWTELEGTQDDIAAGRAHVRLMRAPLAGGPPEIVSQGTLLFGRVLASSTFVVWVESPGEGGPLIFHVYDVVQGKEIDSWQSAPGYAYTDEAFSVDGDFLLYARATTEYDAQGDLFLRREIHLRHLPSGRDMVLAAPDAVQLWGGGPIKPGEEALSTNLVKAGLSGDTLWGVNSTKRFYADGYDSDSSWTIWTRNIRAEKMQLASGGIGPMALPTGGIGSMVLSMRTLAPRTAAFGGPGSAFIDAQVAAGRLAWAVQENNRERLYLLRILTPVP